MTWIATFDIGIKNFAFVILSFPDNSVLNQKKENIPLRKRYMINHECTPEFKNYLETFIYKDFDIVHYQNIDIRNSDCDHQLSTQLFLNIYQILNTYHSLWEDVQFFIIEQQMQFKNNNNIKALKIAQHIYSYFLLHYPTKHIQEYCAYYKTQILGAPSKLKKNERKKWAISTVQTILQFKNMSDILNEYKKKDDISDCILMAISFYYQHFVDQNH